MIELRWKKTAINPETAKAMGVDYSPDNWVIIEDEEYSVLQYRQEEENWDGHNELPDMEWTDWQNVELK